MIKREMKYVDEMICFQEVPDETTLSFSISNCPHHCEGCHSAYLADDIGIPLKKVLEERLAHYDGLITCVLFMGGDDETQVDDLLECANRCHQKGLKTALYSGAYSVSDKIWKNFDYVKIGPYLKEFGPLSEKTTNQKMFVKRSDGLYWEDITYKFWKKGAKME